MKAWLLGSFGFKDFYHFNTISMISSPSDSSAFNLNSRSPAGAEIGADTVRILPGVPAVSSVFPLPHHPAGS